MFQIGEFSKLSGTSTRMLRHYEKLGLLQPEKVDKETGYRYYKAAQLLQINRIKKLQGLGLSLAVIEKILTTDDPKLLAQYLDIRQAEVADELATIQQQQAMLANTMEILGEEKVLDYHVVQKVLPARKVMTCRKIISDANGETLLWQELGAEFQRQKVQMAMPRLGVSIYHDPEYQDNDIDLEIQSSIVGDYQDTEQIKFFTTPTYDVASVTFSGPYEQMPTVMAALGQWIETNDAKVVGPMMNINHVSPSDDPNPENWVTEACIVISL